MNMPALVTAMQNPAVVEALRQIRTATETIEREAPELARYGARLE